MIWQLSRASGVETNPATFVQRSATFASAAANLGVVTLLVRRGEGGLSGYLVTPAGSSSLQAAKHLAHAVGARVEQAELPPGVLVCGRVGWLVQDDGMPASRESQHGVDPAELSRLLANTLVHGCWVAVTMRKPSRGESRASRKWLGHRLGTPNPQHHAMAPEARVISIMAGAGTAAEVRALLVQVAAGLPGFDVATRARVPARWASPAKGFVAALALAGLGILHTMRGEPLVAEWLDRVSPGSGLGRLDVLNGHLTGSLFVAAAALFLYGMARLFGVVPDLRSRVTRAQATHRFPAPPRRSGKPQPPRAEQLRGQQHIGASDGDYPLADEAFLVGPHVVAGLVAAQAGASSGEASTQSRPTPPVLLGSIGMAVGDNSDGPTHLPAADSGFGVAVAGLPGSGKTRLLQAMFGWNCAERARPSGRPGYPGPDNTLVAFESKGGHELGHYRDWAAAAGDAVTVIDLADVSSTGIDLFAVPGTPAKRAEFFVNQMVYAFGPGDIQGRSFEALTIALTAALTTSPDLIGQVPDLPPGRSPLFYAHVLLGGHGDQLGAALASTIISESVRLAETCPGAGQTLRLVDAAAALKPLYQGPTESARRTLTEAARNKIWQLASIEDTWWTPRRAKTTWGDILTGHQAVVINTGTSERGEITDAVLSQRMCSMLMFSLRNAVMRHCDGWLDQGRFVTVFADELSLLAGHSPEVVTWIRDQGRTFGLRPHLATQRPGQLDEKVRTAFLTFATLLSYTQEETRTAAEIADHVSVRPGEWTAEDILLLEPWTVVLRASVNRRRQSAFVTRIRHFDADKAGALTDWGYQPHTPNHQPGSAGPGVPEDTTGPGHASPNPFGPETGELGTGGLGTGGPVRAQLVAAQVFDEAGYDSEGFAVDNLVVSTPSGPDAGNNPSGLNPELEPDNLPPRLREARDSSPRTAG